LPCVELEPPVDASAAVVWLHGLGADGHDFAGIVPQLGLFDAPVRFVFPHAPQRPVTINQGYVMRAWYDIAAPDLTQRQDTEGIRASERQVGELVARERARGIAAERIVLAGFSQGGAIALHTALRHSERLAGVLALSTYLPLAERTAGELHPANCELAVWMGHGLHDPVIPLEHAERSRDALRAMGCAVEWHTYPMPHSVSIEEVADIAAWLRRVLALPQQR
jgi:phospholipase/carboxylesterase